MATSCEKNNVSAAPVIPLHPTEERLIRYMRALGHGHIEVKIVAGYPVMIERPREQVKLT